MSVARMMFRASILAIFCGPLAALSNDSIDFDRDVAPLLARRCLNCHSGSDPKGELDLTHRRSLEDGTDLVVPGKLGQSRLWQRIGDDEMPPENPLPDSEKQVIQQWITGGAQWGTDPIDRFRFTSDNRAGYDWWAWQPLRTDVGSRDELEAQHPIDHFVRKRLSEKGIEPSPPADRRTLIRRLSFDLIGLPPTPQQVDQFIRDPSADAYERLVDRLLDSSHYGERWARHWLDIARFGESQGFERDKFRRHAWRYRDWVIDALNRDMPYDEFARLQLAGDVIHPDNPAAVVATGFLVAGAYDEVGNNQKSAAMKAVVRQDELEDIVSAVGQTFLGLTIHCARCHDHKFDPIRQQEYYQLTAALGGVRHGDREIQLTAKRDYGFQARIDQLQQELGKLEARPRQQILEERRKNPSQRVEVIQPIARWDFDDDLKDQIGSLHGTGHGLASANMGRLQLRGRDTTYVETEAITKTLTAKTLEVWIKLRNLAQQGGAAMSIQSLDGKTFDAIVFDEPRRWRAGSNGRSRTQRFQGPEETGENQLIHIAIVYDADGTITGYRNGQLYGQPYKSDGPVEFRAGEAQVLFGLRNTPFNTGRLLAGELDRAQLYDQALTADQIALSAAVSDDAISDQAILERLTAKQRRQHEQMKFELQQLRTLSERAAEGQTYAVSPRPPEPTHLLIRGNPAAKGELVTPGGVASVAGVSADFGLKPDASDADRRLQLAAWITDPQNPLFARIIVNRLWHYHFGSGLIATPSDFGFTGGRPDHPELIDWLARHLIDGGFSLKSLHREIVMSKTYQQSSGHRADAFAVDAENRYLWRKNPQRLDAESIRDAILMVAGALNTNVGGPGFYDFTTFIHNSQFYVMRDPIGATFNRRSVYRTWVRSARSQFLDAFDCPDPSTKSPKRAITTTPLQALALLNNSFVLRMADKFADRLSKDSQDREGQVATAYHLAYGRPPDETELQQCHDFVDQHGLPAFCRVIFNSNEFLYVD